MNKLSSALLAFFAFSRRFFLNSFGLVRTLKRPTLAILLPSFLMLSACNSNGKRGPLGDYIANNPTAPLKLFLGAFNAIEKKTKEEEEKTWQKEQERRAEGERILRELEPTIRKQEQERRERDQKEEQREKRRLKALEPYKRTYEYLVAPKTYQPGVTQLRLEVGSYYLKGDDGMKDYYEDVYNKVKPCRPLNGQVKMPTPGLTALQMMKLVEENKLAIPFSTAFGIAYADGEKILRGYVIRKALSYDELRVRRKLRDSNPLSDTEVSAKTAELYELRVERGLEDRNPLYVKEDGQEGKRLDDIIECFKESVDKGFLPPEYFCWYCNLEELGIGTAPSDKYKIKIWAFRGADGNFIRKEKLNEQNMTPEQIASNLVTYVCIIQPPDEETRKRFMIPITSLPDCKP